LKYQNNGKDEKVIPKYGKDCKEMPKYAIVDMQQNVTKNTKNPKSLIRF
jgi:hypothetical protein